MKIQKALLVLLAATLSWGAVAPRHANAQVSVSFFYDNLDPYGEWVDDPDYGYCWHPTGVDENWAPYTDGYWAYTDGGWTWVSYEDYGGIVYHYGRWAHIPGEGWVWVPGETWAPAWVSWRTSDDYVGWAPLPPEAHWHAGFGFGDGVDAQFDIGPGCYSFVSVDDFGAPALGAVIVSRERNVTIINNTTNITNITVNNSNVYTGGPKYEMLAARSKRPIPTLTLVRQSTLGQGGKALSRQQGNQLVVVAPKVIAPASGKMPAPAKVAKTLTGVKPDKGWGVVKDPQQRQQLEAKIKTQSANNPARPVSAEELKVVKEKAAVPATPGVAGPVATPKPAKAKKNKSPSALSTNDLINAPAKEEPGNAAAAPTPKTKGKSKKSKSPNPAAESNFANPGAAADETPIPKKSRSKKSKTPPASDNSAFDSETPAKHSKSNDSNLQPFMSRDAAVEKPSKKPEYSAGNEPRGVNPPSQAGTPKSKKKKSKDEENNPPTQ